MAETPTPAEVSAEKAKADAAEKVATAKLEAEAAEKQRVDDEAKKAAIDKANTDAAANLKAIAAHDNELVAKGLPRDIAAHPPVTASPGQVCQVEGCGWTFGDLAKGIEPHPTQLVIPKQAISAGPPKPLPPAPKPSVSKCAPVGILNECPTCHWTAATSAEPHPVIA
jgi:hypothetical protein